MCWVIVWGGGMCKVMVWGCKVIVWVCVMCWVIIW